MKSARHAFLALALLLTVLVSAYFVGVDPMLQFAREKRETTASLEHRLSQYRQIVAARSALVAEIADLERNATVNNRDLYDQPTLALALAEMQRKVKIFASSRGARLLTTQARDADDGADSMRMELTVRLEGSLAAVHGFLLNLAETTPPIQVGKLVIVGRPSSVGQPRDPRAGPGARQLDVTLVLVGYRRGGGASSGT